MRSYVFMKFYADKIEADFVVIKGAKKPDWPIACEKMQIYDLKAGAGG